MAQAVVSGRGYQSHFGSRLSFGLGNTHEPVAISIQWHNGKKQEFININTDHCVILVEGESNPYNSY